MFKLFSIFIFLITIILVYNWLGGPTSTSPQVTFHYIKAIDNLLCSKKGKDKIKPAWVTELKEKKPWLEQGWQAVGPQLLSETVREVGKPFTYTKINISIFLCPELPGFSFPIIIPVSMYLDSASNQSPWHRSEFIDMVYHEMLHTYIMKALHWNYWTPTLKKYSNEDFNTKLHLHLFALQKSVYLHLGMKKQWEFIVLRLNQAAPQYKRAITIINQEGYAAFVNELKN